MTIINAIPANSGATTDNDGTFHPNMLLVGWELSSRARNWPAALAIAKGIIAALPAEPIGWIYHGFAQQQMGQLREARETLLAGAQRFPSDWRIAYNLACYSAQSGDVAGAQDWLERAFEVGDTETVRSCALKEPSLMSLPA